MRSILLVPGSAVGAVYVNALLPKVFVFVFGTFNIDLLEDLSCLELLYGTRRSTRYCGASPFKHLLVGRAILNSILDETGSQCNDSRIGLHDQTFWLLLRHAQHSFTSFVTCLANSLYIHTVNSSNQ